MDKRTAGELGRAIGAGKVHPVELVEAQLAADWSNADLIAAHKRQRDDLAKLMERWEALFAEAQEEAGA